jgi:hypothetical protein
VPAGAQTRQQLLGARVLYGARALPAYLVSARALSGAVAAPYLLGKLAYKYGVPSFARGGFAGTKQGRRLLARTAGADDKVPPGHCLRSYRLAFELSREQLRAFKAMHCHHHVLWNFLALSVNDKLDNGWEDFTHAELSGTAKLLVCADTKLVVRSRRSESTVEYGNVAEEEEVLPAEMKDILRAKRCAARATGRCRPLSSHAHLQG